MVGKVGKGRARVLILGYGEMGHAFHTLLKTHAEISVWQRHPAAGLPTLVLEEAVSAADILVFCLPAVAHEEILQRIMPALPAEAICLSIAKGLDDQGRTVAQVFADHLGPCKDATQPYAFLYGPMIAEEIIAGRVGFAELISSSPAITDRVQELFRNTQLLLHVNADLTGCSWSVILKNVYALLFGMIDGLGLGDNMRGYLSVAVLAEFNQLIQALGGQSGTVYSLAGLGDLITTATSVGSHHHALGVQLARGQRDRVVGEGVHTMEMLVRYRLLELTLYPIFKLVYSVVIKGEQPGPLFERHLREINSTVSSFR